MIATPHSLPGRAARRLKRIFWPPPTVKAVDGSSTIAIENHDGFDVAFRRHTTDEDVIGHSFKNDIFLPGIPEHYIYPSDVVVDVGAHIGTFSLLAARKCTSGRVLAVEACLESFNLLRINVALNAASNVTPIHLALAGEAGVTTLHHDVENWGHSTVSPMTGRGERVRSNSLEGLFSEQGITFCNLLKLNCEGAEFPILLNSPADVLARVGFLLVLYHCDLYRDATLNDLRGHLESSGFTTTIRNNNAQRGWLIGRRS